MSGTILPAAPRLLMKGHERVAAMLHRRASAWCSLTLALMMLTVPAVRAQVGEGGVQTTFPVKFVSAGMVYLVGGSAAGLAEGQTLTIKRRGTVEGSETEFEVAEIEIDSVASVSAAGRITSARSEVVAGDVAYLSSAEAEKLRTLLASEEVRKYPQVASFTEADPLDREVRESQPRPLSPEVNRIRGRIGVDFSDINASGGGLRSWQFGYVLRIDAARLGGTYWKASGFYRGRVFSQSGVTPQTTLRDLINRTYHLSISYDNPSSQWVAGAGRMYIPWASSLSTIDGAYGGRRFGHVTVGAFGGTTPDPSSWNYSRNRQLFGAFANFTGGGYESLRYSGTAGMAISRINWHPDRQFGFFENNFFYKRIVSVYSDVEADLRLASQNNGQRSFLFSRSFITIRVQPHRAISFDVNENYFRNIPTFDIRLVGTGLLDQFLFQGVSGGVRLQLPYRLGIYGNTGRSSRTDDFRASWNYLYGGTAGNILNTGIRADFRYSKFDSSFGRGSYKVLMLNRDMTETLRLELRGGQQDIVSALTSQSRARFVDATADWLLGGKYIFGAGITVYRGQVESYNQYYLTLGYRFDLRRGN